MRLRELGAEFIRATGGGNFRRQGEDSAGAQGVLLDCPLPEHGHWVVVWFANPVGGGKPAPAEYMPKPRWYRVGETLDTLTLTPSVNLDEPGPNGEPPSCRWHGVITDGEASP